MSIYSLTEQEHFDFLTLHQVLLEKCQAGRVKAVVLPGSVWMGRTSIRNPKPDASIMVQNVPHENQSCEQIIRLALKGVAAK